MEIAFNVNPFSLLDIPCKFLASLFKLKQENPAYPKLNALQPYFVDIEKQVASILEVNNVALLDSAIFSVLPHYLRSLFDMVVYLENHQEIVDEYINLLNDPELQKNLSQRLGTFSTGVYSHLKQSQELDGKLANLSDKFLSPLVGELAEAALSSISYSFVLICYLEVCEHAKNPAMLNALKERLSMLLQQSTVSLATLLAKLTIITDQVVAKIFQEHQIEIIKVPELIYQRYKNLWGMVFKEDIGIHEFGSTQEEARRSIAAHLAELIPSLEQGASLGILSQPMQKRLFYLRNYFRYAGPMTKEYPRVFSEEMLISKPKWKGRPVLTEADLRELDCPFPRES